MGTCTSNILSLRVVKSINFKKIIYKVKNEGVDGICVSNHGGRQLDCATASIDALPRIREKVGRDYPLIFDSGIRSGSDIIRALALGADFTMMGRPLMYGIGADQECGLNRILEIIREELNISLGLVGLTDINEVNDEVISKKYFKNMKY